MKMRNLFSLYLSGAVVFSSPIVAMRDNPNQDPKINMAYKDAFDQESIHRDYADLMRQWGCHRNVFEPSFNSPELLMPNLGNEFLLLLQQQASEKKYWKLMKNLQYVTDNLIDDLLILSRPVWKNLTGLAYGRFPSLCVKMEFKDC